MSVSLSSKIRLMCFLATSIFLYACESRTFTAELQKSIQAMEMRCYRKIQGISYKDHVTNDHPCQDPAGNLTTRRPPDHRKETQTAVVCTHFPCIRSVQNRLARHSERGKKTRQTEEEKTISAFIRQVPEGSREEKHGGNWL